MDEYLWINADNIALLTDQYELTMLQAYWAQNMHADATFSLYFRELPPTRRYMLACGQQSAARLMTRLRFSRSALDKLASLGTFQDAFLRWLQDFRFSGDIMAMAEGTPVFGYEPLLEVTAPVAEAQLLEPLLMNMVHLQTVLASKAARVVTAAAGRPVADFGLRRMHGLDAAAQGVRAYRIAGIEATSNVLAGVHFGSKVVGTMAHSFIEAVGDERAAFRQFCELYPGTTLLVDTFDTLAGVDKIIALKKELGAGFDVGAVRLDSGDINRLSKAVRERLDEAGLQAVKIVASGGLDEYKIADLVHAKAPIDSFGVGTSMGTSADAAFIDLSYKLTEYDGEPRLKNATGKPVYPGAKQVWRYRSGDGKSLRDELTLRDETRVATPLLTPAVRAGQAVIDAPDIVAAQAYASRELAALPPDLLDIAPGASSYPLSISPAAQTLWTQTRAKLNGA